MTIDYPQALWLLFGLLPIGAILWRRYVSGRADLRALGGKWQELAYTNLFVVKWFFSSLALFLFFALLVLSLAGFRWGQTPLRDERRGTDVVLCFDVSRSMLARDIAPSRLERSAVLAKGLIESAPGARFGVVVFKGRAVQLIPITEDSSSISGVLDALSPDMVSSPGTDIDAGITVSAAGFLPGAETRKVIVLFSDGGLLEGNPLKTAEAAQRNEIEIHVVAAATESPTPILLPDGGAVRDASGNVVMTELRRDVVEGIARAGGGELFDLTQTGSLRDLRDAVLGGRADRRRGFVYATHDRFRTFLSVGLAFLFLSIVVRGVRWKKVF